MYSRCQPHRLLFSVPAENAASRTPGSVRFHYFICRTDSLFFLKSFISQPDVHIFRISRKCRRNRIRFLRMCRFYKQQSCFLSGQRIHFYHVPAYAIPRGKKYVLLLQDAGSAWDVDAYPAPPAMLHPLSAFPAHLETHTDLPATPFSDVFQNHSLSVTDHQHRAFLDSSALCLLFYRKFLPESPFSRFTERIPGALVTQWLSVWHTDNGSKFHQCLVKTPGTVLWNHLLQCLLYPRFTDCFIISELSADTRIRIRNTFPSTAGTGIPYAMDAIAPAV